MIVLEVITAVLVVWGTIGACCLLFLGIRADIQAYHKRKNHE
jgi:hypothetical protein